MSAPRLEIRLDLIESNARSLVDRLERVGIEVCGVTKATLGSPEVAHQMLDAGVTSLGESRIENIERLRRAGIKAEIALIRSPMLSQVDRVVASADVSLNSEIAVIECLSASAERQCRRHCVILMVELGDLREGIMPEDLMEVTRRVLKLPGIKLRGIGANLACQSGVIPDASNMAELSDLATSTEMTLGVELDIISGGNSANLPWALDPETAIGRINHLRLGESILLGREPTRRSLIDGLRSDAVSLIGEVIEVKLKPSEPRGARGQTVSGAVLDRRVGRRESKQVIVALGTQDLDVEGLVAPLGFEIVGVSSDHLVLRTASSALEVGDELRFDVNYSALLRSMTSPFVTRRLLRSELSSPLAC